MGAAQAPLPTHYAVVRRGEEEVCAGPVGAPSACSLALWGLTAGGGGMEQMRKKEGGEAGIVRGLRSEKQPVPARDQPHLAVRHSAWRCVKGSTSAGVGGSGSAVSHGKVKEGAPQPSGLGGPRPDSEHCGRHDDERWKRRTEVIWQACGEKKKKGGEEGRKGGK